jgi:hypothetical protein
VEAQLTPREPSIDLPLLPVGRHGMRNYAGEAAVKAVESALAWFFSKVLR